jgi:hypothetical protein
MRKPLERTSAHPARISAGFLILLIASLLLAACESNGNTSSPPTATRAAVPVGPAPTRLPFAAALTAEARDTPYVLERGGRPARGGHGYPGRLAQDVSVGARHRLAAAGALPRLLVRG